MSTNGSQRLDGWKAIAAHLGRDVRTAQRWHEERGMPVHRVPGGKGAVVFAHSGEIDEWLGSRPAAGPAADVHGAGPASGVPDAARRRRVVWRVSAALMLAVLALVGVMWMRPLAPPRPVARLALRGNDIVALDASGQDLWSYRLPNVVPDASGMPRPALVRWGHGQKDASATRAVSPPLEPSGEALALIGFARQQPDQSPMASDAVYRFTAAGRLAWRYTPDMALEFGAKRFTGPWMTSAWATGAGTGRGPMLAFIHHTWWPSFVVRVDAGGVGRLTFVNAGHVESLARVQRPGRRLLLAGGVNNEYRGASLALIDEDGPPASSPQTPGSEFDCTGCPPGRPLRYLVFPRSELTVALGMPYNFAVGIFETATGEIEVSVREHSDPPLRTVYHLSPDFVPVSAARADVYWETHERLSKAGRLDHGVADCPERTRPAIVRTWAPDAGWAEVAVAPGGAGR